MKIFGCVAYAHNPDLGFDKFAYRGVPCVFLGYLSTQKGYKLLNLLTIKTFVSRDVHFVEHIFPFHKNAFKDCLDPIPPSIPPLSNVELHDDLSLHLPTDSSHMSHTPPSTSSPQTQPHQTHTSRTQTYSPPYNSDPNASVTEPIRKSTRTHEKPSW